MKQFTATTFRERQERWLQYAFERSMERLYNQGGYINSVCNMDFIDWERINYGGTDDITE